MGASAHEHMDLTGTAATPPAHGAPAEAAAGAPARRRGPSATVVGVTLFVALIALRVFVAEPFEIPSESMEPALKPGDRALVEKIAGRGSPHRGELVAFHRPGHDEVLLKRVVAVGGDTVGLEDGLLVVNGRTVREPYANTKSQDSVYFGPVRIGPGKVFVMGDNRGISEDSRDFGAVPTRDVIGRAVARLWPPGRWGIPH
jgi:signal peptidase I